MSSLLGRLAGTAAHIATAPVTLTLSCAATGLRFGTDLTTSVVRGLSDTVPPDARAAVISATRELVGGAPVRRRWRRDDRCWIEVRNLTADTGSALLEAVQARSGVRSATLNHPTSRLVVSVDPAGPSLDELCTIVSDVEAQTSGDEGAAEPTDLPGDGVVLGGLLIATAAHGIGFFAAAAGRTFFWPALPSGLVAAVTAVDYQPRLRAVVEERLGDGAADTALALAAASVYTLTQSPASLAVEFFRHLNQVGEMLAASQSWQRHEPALAEHADSPRLDAHVTRPCPMPPGPIERHAHRSGLAQGVAASSVGLLTRDINAAATAAVVTAPKAARNAREAFAATLGRGLAEHHDVLALHPYALRRLDRIDAVVVDPRVLLTDRLRVSRLRSVPERHREASWEWAQEQVNNGALGVGWHRVPPRGAEVRNGEAKAEVFVGHAHHPLAADVLGAIRRADIEAVSVLSDELGDLRSSFDELHQVAGTIDSTLADTVEALQADGRTVALLSSVASRAMTTADLAIGLVPPNRKPPWHADLLIADLPAAWRVIRAVPAARNASRRGVELATSATLLGAVLMIPGVRGQGPGPVTAGAAAGLATGLWLARGVLAEPVPTPAPVQDWHAMSVDEVREALPHETAETSQKRSRLAASAGASAAAVGNIAGPVTRLAAELGSAVRQELSDPLTPVLAVGAAASALLGSPIDAILVGSVLTGNAMLAASQQVRAERLLRRLLAVEDPPARRLVDDGCENVNAARLLAGDLIEVRSGEVIPADCRIIQAADLEVDESALTGESLPVPKQVEATPGAVLAERSCMLYATTTVVAGTAVALVTTVGAHTQVRRAAEVAPAHGSAVGLQSQLRELTNRALPFSLAGGALVGGLGLMRLATLRQAVTSGVAVAVAAVPEGLPLVATLAQQASARRLSRVGALVRSPKSVEALGRIDVVCFDKTGTLSENRLRVSRVHSAPGFTDEQVLAFAASATPPKNGTRHEHATDAAVIAAARTEPPAPGDTVHLPFRSGRPFSASLIGTELVLKGAPEVVLAACAGRHGPTDAATEVVHEMAESGLRVIAVARRTVTSSQSRAARESDERFAELCGKNLRVAGLLGISDTPREESAGLLRGLRDQDIAVRLVTGDHPVTAAAIAAELGLPVTADQVISGSAWEVLSRRGQEAAVRDKVVFARMTPEHKVQVVQTLERTGLVCAMVGDGANDAAAIRSATVGIGVAGHGTDPARTAADVMLLDGRIGALLDAIDEGHQLWRRVQAAVAVLLGGNAGEVAFAIVGSALTGRSPLNTRQLLLVNMMTDALPAAALAVSPTVGTNGGTGRGPDQAALWRTVAIRGTTTAAAATSAWLMAGFSLQPRRASTVALVALVSTQLGQTLIDSHGPLVVTTAVGSLVTLGALISTPGVSQLLGCTPLGPIGWTQALGTAGVATAVTVFAPKVVGRVQSSMSSTPSRHNTAYISRSGTSMKRDTTEIGSEVAVEAVVDTPSTLHTTGVQKANTP